MEEPLFNDMSPEDLLAWIENAEKVLDQKVATETADIEKRQQRLAKLIARRSGKDDKAKAKAKAKAKPAAQKPAGRPPQASAPAAKAKEPKVRDAKAQEKAQDAKAREPKAQESMAHGPEASEPAVAAE